MDANNAQTNENESQLKPVAIKVDWMVSEEQAELLRRAWVESQRCGLLPVLGPGVSLMWPQEDLHERLARIERKLDMLIEALAAEDEQEPEARTLDGEEAGGERDQSQPL